MKFLLLLCFVLAKSQRVDHSYIELIVVYDYSFASLLNETTVNYIEKAVDQVNKIYDPLDIKILLRAVEPWPDRRISFENKNSSVYIKSLYTLSHEQSFVKYKYDAIVLVTALNLNNGSVFGRAFLNTVCSANAVAVVRHAGNSFFEFAHTIAHELGHLLGASHDDCKCESKQCVMHQFHARSKDWSLQEWSLCSVEKLKEVHSMHCLSLPSNPRTQASKSYCGNGRVEVGEECDCNLGLENRCVDYCNLSTCKLNLSSNKNTFVTKFPNTICKIKELFKCIEKTNYNGEYIKSLLTREEAKMILPDFQSFKKKDKMFWKNLELEKFKENYFNEIDSISLQKNISTNNYASEKFSLTDQLENLTAYNFNVNFFRLLVSKVTLQIEQLKFKHKFLVINKNT